MFMEDGFVQLPLISEHLTGGRLSSEILDDLSCRFIIHTFHEERFDMIRMCFRIERAYWFYKDYFCPKEEKYLVPCRLKEFATQIFEHVSFLRPHLSNIDKILEDWKEYKEAIPTYGAIIISEDQKHVLLVQSFYSGISWAFPKGKVNQNEDPMDCAAREVFEETGYDISNRTLPSDYLEADVNYQTIRLYLVRNVPIETAFRPARHEIKTCKWFPIESLPINKRDQISKINLGISPNSFFMVMPFIKILKDNYRTISSFNKQHKSSNEFALNRKKPLKLRKKLSRRRYVSDNDGDANKINLLTCNNYNINMYPSETTTTATTVSAISSSASTIGITCSKSSTSVEQMKERQQVFNVHNSIENSSNVYFDEERNPSNIVSNNVSEAASTVNGNNLKDNGMAAIMESCSIIDNNDIIIKNNSVLNESLTTTSESNTSAEQEKKQEQNTNMINNDVWEWYNFNSWLKYLYSFISFSNK